MKNLLMLLVLALPCLVCAQDDLKKPKDIGISEFDEFKNNSFAIYKKSNDFKKMVDEEQKFTPEDVKAVNALKDDLIALQEKSEALVKKAKDVKPMTKAPAATKNTQAAGKALKRTSENLTYVTENMIPEE
jgi:hypothetical protein